MKIINEDIEILNRIFELKYKHPNLISTHKELGLKLDVFESYEDFICKECTFVNGELIDGKCMIVSFEEPDAERFYNSEMFNYLLDNKKTEIDSNKQNVIVMEQTIITTSGDGNVVNTGNNSKVSVTINISKGNKDELVKSLEENGISEEDRIELVEIVDSEKPNIEDKTFGKKVNEWTKKMLGKSLDGTWKVGLATAAGLLTEILKKYYGM